MQGVSAENLMEIKELHDCMLVNNLNQTEAWHKACESERYKFMKCILVIMDGHVIWLRVDPGAYNWESNG